jgi:hypothetical protein
MKRILAVALAAGAIGSAVAQPSVGVSIGINQPGVYGRINIGNGPPPALVYEQPVVYAQPRVAMERQPIYLYVPPAHQQNWGRYCGRYNACGQPVYFVRDDWVRERYQSQHPGNHYGWDKNHPHGDHDNQGHGNKGNGHKGDHD